MKSASAWAEQLAGSLLPTLGRVTELVGNERCESWDNKAEKKGPVWNAPGTMMTWELAGTIFRWGKCDSERIWNTECP